MITETHKGYTVNVVMTDGDKQEELQYIKCEPRQSSRRRVTTRGASDKQALKLAINNSAGSLRESHDLIQDRFLTE